VKFGIIPGVPVPKPWTEGKESGAFWADLEKCVVADEVGFDYVWASEHHFLEEYSHCSSSDTFLTAVAMRTERIRLATGIINLCPPINHPVRVAERLAMLDILSNGRLDVGTGRGSGSLEVNGFGVTNDVSKEMWAEAIAALPSMWTSENFSWDGKWFSVPERNVLPKPVQKPHPPLWVTAGNMSTATVAGEKGLGLAMFGFVPPPQIREPIEAYRKAIADAVPVGEFVNEQTMVGTICVCLEDGDRAVALWREKVAHAKPLLTAYFDTVFPPPEPVNGPVPQSTYRRWLDEAAAAGKESADSNRLAVQAPDPASIGHAQLLDQGMCVGGPDDVIKVIKAYEEVGVDQVAFSFGHGLDIPHDVLLESIRTIGEKVISHWR
jgi:alkanesulfonate monooxygenase SsuD/methylene tetrahydromethanopterin reductase-like flavin-dependent oxidoreductase (luciferase family)